MWNVVTHSEPGGHLVNEDALAVSAERDVLICALADGQGGQPGGGRAARLACDTLVKLAEGKAKTRLFDPRTWTTLLREVDERVASDPEAGFTTLVGLCVAGDAICGASSGDSGAFLLGPRGVWEELTGRQAKNPPVGSGVADCRPFSASPTQPWKLLIMSDGVWKYAGRERVRTAATEQSGRDIIDTLVRAARLPGSGRLQDDFTLILLERPGQGDIGGEG